MSDILKEALKARAHQLGKNAGELTPDQIAEVEANIDAYIPVPKPEVISEASVEVSIIESEIPTGEEATGAETTEVVPEPRVRRRKASESEPEPEIPPDS